MAVALAGWTGYTQGVKAERVKFAQAAIEQQEAQGKLAEELAYLRSKAERKTKQRVRTVYVEKDSTGCADNDALNSVLNVLRTSEDRPTTD